MKTKLTFLTLLLMAGFTMFAQKQVEQQGYVRSIGRPDNKYGERLGGATIRVSGQHNDVRSNDNGDFTITFDDATVGVTTYSLSRVRLAGYEVNEKEVIGRQYAVSAKVPQEIVMVSLAVKQALEDSITARIDRRYKAEYAKLEREKEQLGEEYHARLQKLFDEYDKRDQLISEMVERYANTDYAKLDSTAAKINAYIETGELEKADSIIRAMDVAKLESEYKMVREDNDRLRAELQKGEKAQENLYQNLYTAYNGKYEIFAQQFMNDSAAFYLEKIVELDTTNVENLLRAGEFIRSFISDMDKAMALNLSGLRNAISQNGGESSMDVSNAYGNIGGIYYSIGRFEEAKEYFLKALNIGIALSGEMNSDVATYYENLGLSYSNMGLGQEAYEYARKSMDIRLELYGERHLHVASSFCSLGSVYFVLGMFDKSLDCFNKSVEIIIDIEGDNSSMLTANYNNIGFIYSQVFGDEKLALEYFFKSIKIEESIYGEKFLPLLTSYNNVAVTYSGMKLYNEAIEYFNKVSEISTALLGENNVYNSESYLNVGVLYEDLGDYNKAVECYNKALEINLIIDEVPNKNTASVYLAVAGLYLKLHDNIKSIECFNKSLDIYLALGGNINSDVAFCYFTYGKEYEKLADYNQALFYYRKAIDVYDDLHVESNVITANLLSRAGFVSVKLNNYSDALEYYNKSLVMYVSVKGENDRSVGNRLYNIGDVYKNLNDIQKAMEYSLRAKKIFEISGCDASDGFVVSNNKLNYECYMHFAKFEPSYSDTISDFLSTKLFVAQFPIDSTSKSELQGELYLLQLDDWNMETVGNVFDLNKSLNGKKKNVVLYKDGKVLNRKLDKKTEFDIILKEVGKDEHDEVIGAWKKTVKKEKSIDC